MLPPDDDDAVDGLTVTRAEDGARLVDVCWVHLGAIARRAVGPLITAGAITVDGRPARIAEPVRVGQRIHLAPGAVARLTEEGLTTPPSPLPLAVVHEDDDVLVVDKPSGLHVHPMGRHRDDTLLGCVLWRAGARPGVPWTAYRPSPAHRLDRPTSGLVLFAKSVRVRGAVQRMLDAHAVGRTYRAWVHGVVAEERGRITAPLGRDPADRASVAVAADGRPATSVWQVVQRQEDRTLMELQLETGRTHQLRVHLAHIGHPILGDVRYGAAADGPPADPAVGDVIALRAVRLTLPHPRGAGTLDLHAPPVTQGVDPLDG